MKRKSYLTIACLAAALSWTSCVDTENIESELSGLEDRVAALEKTASQINGNAISAYKLITEGQIIMAVNAHKDGTVYRLDLSDGSTIDIYITAEGTGITPVIGIDEDGGWVYSTDGTEFLPISDSDESTDTKAIPMLRANEDNVWELSTDGGASWFEVTDKNGNRMPANAGFTNSLFTSVTYNEADSSVSLVLATGETIKIPVYESLTMNVENYTEGMDIKFDSELEFDVTFSDDVIDATVKVCPDGWRVRITEEGKFIINSPATGEAGEYTVEIWLLSEEEYKRTYKYPFRLGNVDPDACDAWNEYMTGDENNVLLDFSYAGYMHGEEAPAEVTVTENPDGTCTASNGYKVYNIESYGADGTDDQTDREAFIAMLTDALGEPTINKDQMTFPHSNQPRNIVFYFPEGNFILHTAADDVNGISQSVIIRGSNIILKGAGRDKTTLTMADPNQPSQGPSVMYSSPDMIQLKHNTGIQYTTVLATVTSDAHKGSFSVETGGGNLTAGDWVCLFMQNDSKEAVDEELYPYTAKSSWAISQISNADRGVGGVVVKDIHRIKSVSGNTVTFHEPIMHEIDADWGWKIVGYQHYENLGVEDITFKGNAKEDFDHHFSWEDDGAFKPISMTRVVNSWMRRVDFVSVSEASSIIESANVSVYDCTISGQRGHSAIRSQASSRVFIGAVLDKAHGKSMDVLGHDVTGSDPDEITGQYHAVGVSKESMGAVLWRNTWGSDGCFESHATQPRATLLDCCEGSFRRWRQGGDDVQMPNHLDDLIIWNFNNTTPFTELPKWIWWDDSSDWWKILPPVVIGFHGEQVDFETASTQIKRLESNGTPVQPESLYEAQLEDRLGAVPAWLRDLKAVAAIQ